MSSSFSFSHCGFLILPLQVKIYLPKVCLWRKQTADPPSLLRVHSAAQTGRVGQCFESHASGVRDLCCRRHNHHWVRRQSRPVSEEMKLKQRMVVLCAVLLLLGLAKLFLLDGGEGSAASRRDLRAFRKVSSMPVLAALKKCRV